MKTNTITKTRTQSILSVIKIIALIGYIGAIVAGLRIIIPFIAGFVAENPSFDTGTGLDELRDTHLLPYLSLMSFIIALAILKVQMWESLREILDEINLSSPFSIKIATMLEKMSYLILGIGIVYITGDGYAAYLSKTISAVDKGLLKSEFQYFFSAGIVYVMAQVFRHGVELQEESDLTV
ncbi:DUF2975 domain-containing protein [Emticicia fontis]